jgi:hypothetical protein
MAAQRAEVERVFEDPQVSEQWSKLVEWLDRYGVYWRDETPTLSLALSRLEKNPREACDITSCALSPRRSVLLNAGFT